ncbi:MAG TPA: metallophosphoesterase [Candidatus Sulfotelmatobacter sp.]|jgi:bis(5'-nucleosyl)-tetraphosphatase (symmetrical)|nr:metallophosphoesterase [Candidatus Sulfotelmatobacter sp.]
MRWIIGDIHGCVRELDDLLRKIRFDPASDELWCTGDIVNTGPDSLRALSLWLEAGGRSVIGNHDAYALLARSGAAPRRKDRLEELFESERCDELLGVLRAFPVMARLEREAKPGVVRLVHAGLHPEWKELDEIAERVDSMVHDDEWLQSDDVQFMTRVRCCDVKGERIRFVGRPEDAHPPYREWDAFYKGSDLIVHGHWAMRGYYRGERTLGLDSGCVYGGRLTAWAVDEERVESVACRETTGY